MDQHIILNGLKLQGHSGTGQRSKVRHLSAGVKTPKLDVSKTQIIPSTLCNDFDGAIALHKHFIVQVSAVETTHNVLEVKTCGKDKNK